MSETNQSVSPLCEHMLGNASTMFTRGILLLFIVFSIKLVYLNWSTTTFSSTMAVPRVMMQRQAAMFDLNFDVERIETEISDLRQDRREAESNNEKNDIQKQIENLEAKRDKLQDKNKKERDELSKYYRDAMLYARQDTVHSTASVLGWLHWGAWLKLLLDLVKILAFFMILYSSLKLVADPQANGYQRTFAIAASTVVLLSLTMGGLLTFFS